MKYNPIITETNYVIDGNPIKVGDLLDIKVLQIPITNNNLESLVKLGIVEKYEEAIVPINETYYVNKLFKKVVLSQVNSESINIILPLLLKEIAIEMDHRYIDTIKDSKEIFAISVLNGKIIKLNKDKIKNYRNFAAFRSKEEAEMAKYILKAYFKIAYEYRPKRK